MENDNKIKDLTFQKIDQENSRKINQINSTCSSLSTQCFSDFTERKIDFKPKMKSCWSYEEDNLLLKLKEEDNLPFYIKKGSDNLIYDSQLIRTFDLGLRVLINPVDVLHFSEILDVYSIENDLSNFNNLTGIDKLKAIQEYIKDYFVYPRIFCKFDTS